MKRAVVALGALLAVGTVTAVGVAASGESEPREEMRTATCRVDSLGYCEVSHGLEAVPSVILVTPHIQRGYAHWTLTVVKDSADVDTFKVRAMYAKDQPRQNLTINFSYHAFGKAPIEPPPPTTTTTTTTTTPPPDPGGEPLGLSKIPWEGGPAYYKQWSSTDSAGWDDPSFFPIAVWFQDVVETHHAPADKAAGINTYLELTNNSSMDLVRRNGMWAIPSNNEGGLTPGSETIGYLVTDEADMIYGPGWSDWNGKFGWGSCVPSDARCGYTVSKTLAEKRPFGPLYQNYGKGVMFWESEDQASGFVNGPWNQFLSVDIYHYTDDASCTGVSANIYIRGSGPMDPYAGLPQLTKTECHRAWNYGQTMDKLRKIDARDGKLQPLWNFVEMGSPFDTFDDKNHANDLEITREQLHGAVMSSLIHEARGIAYFAHNFGGDSCRVWRAQRECPEQAESIRLINEKIKALAPVLNTQSLVHDFGNVDTMLKWHDGAYYVFAMQDEPGYNGGPTSGTRTFTLPAGLNASSVEVLFEGRSIPVEGGKFTDAFKAEYAWHAYRITP
jgi:hypothetical protein